MSKMVRRLAPQWLLWHSTPKENSEPATKKRNIKSAFPGKKRGSLMVKYEREFDNDKNYVLNPS